MPPPFLLHTKSFIALAQGRFVCSLPACTPTTSLKKNIGTTIRKFFSIPTTFIFLKKAFFQNTLGYAFDDY